MEKDYIPPLKYKVLTSFYDIIIRLLLPDQEFKGFLLDQVTLEPGNTVLDFGCGTGTLTLMAKKKEPKAEVIGIDIDTEVLGIAKQKAADSQTEIELIKYAGDVLPFADSSVDIILSSLVFHHLSTEEKKAVLMEFIRILKPGGQLNIGDLGPPANAAMGLISNILKRLEPIEDNIKGILPQLLTGYGFKDVNVIKFKNSLSGTLYIYRGNKAVQQ